MNREAVSMARHALNAAIFNDVNALYHWATMLQLDARARGANGPQAYQHDERRMMDNQDRDGWSAPKRLGMIVAEDAIEESRR